MKFTKSLVIKILVILFTNQIFFYAPKAQSAEEIKIIYSVFSRTVTVDSLKTFAESGNSSKSLRKILNATGSSDNEIRSILNNNFEIPITIASKLVYSEIGNAVSYTHLTLPTILPV